MSTHYINIVLRVNSFSGVLGQAAAILMQSGLNYARHQLKDESGTSHKILTLETEGNTIPNDILQQKLPEINGVIEVVSITSKPKEDSKLMRRHGALNDEEEQLIDTIIDVWPAILTPLQAYEDSCPRKEREAKVTRIGVYVGIRQAIHHPLLKDTDSIYHALHTVVVPALKKIAECEVEGDELKTTVSIFSRRFTNSMDLLFSQENDKCYFLIGFIEGILSQASKLPSTYVTEPKCRAIGDQYCLFKVNIG